MINNKCKVLVAVADYPDNYEKVSLMYVHIRNRYYQTHGIDVTVLNFNTNVDYVIDNIRVISLSTYKSKNIIYDILICHAANIRNHYLFLRRYGKHFKKFIFFFHGHEVLKINKVYSKPFFYVKKSKFMITLQNIYDCFKLYIWKKYYKSVILKSQFVFVSRWMLTEFLKWTKIPFSCIKNNYSITYNCIGTSFEKFMFNSNCSKEYDFITIRSNLDGSKYCIDLVNEIAKSNPNMRFLVVGKGNFFSFYKKAKNILWLNKTMNHDEILHYLQKTRCALMPTRTDAQGLMMCEMASTGIPLITSDIPVCHEVFQNFNNVRYISNNTCDIDINDILIDLEKDLPYSKNNRYFCDETCSKELELLLLINNI